MQLRSRSVEDEPRFVVGMDAHARKLAVSVWDWSDRFNACLHREIKCVDVDAMVKTYERHVDLDSITVIEASTNAAILKRRLNEAGFRAEVVRSDTIADKERKRKVCDIQDARNLALAYIKGDVRDFVCLALAYVKGDVRDFVWTPSDEYSEYRDVMFAYRDTVKELTRTSNRIWSVCSRKGYALPGSGASAAGRDTPFPGEVPVRRWSPCARRSRRPESADSPRSSWRCFSKTTSGCSSARRRSRAGWRRPRSPSRRCCGSCSCRA